MTTSAVSGEERLGGLGLSEAFPDPNTAAMVAAARAGKIQEMETRIAKGADVNYRGSQGITPLAWTVAVGDVRAASRLLEANADPNMKMANNDSAMAIAVELGSPTMLELLLKNRGDPNLRGRNNDPLLHIATIRQRKDQMDMLLKHKADINAPGGRDTSTAAISAVAVGRFDLAHYLVERGLTRDLQRLGAAAEGRVVPKTSEQQRWKDRLIAVLKERGVTFPALVRRVVPPPSRIAEEERGRNANQKPPAQE